MTMQFFLLAYMQILKVIIVTECSIVTFADIFLSQSKNKNALQSEFYIYTICDFLPDLLYRRAFYPDMKKFFFATYDSVSPA